MLRTARAWIYDKQRKADYQETAKRAKAQGRKPPARWQVNYYDLNGRLRTESFQKKTQAEQRCGKLEENLNTNAYVDPVEGKITINEIGEKWIEARHDLKPTTWWKYRGLLNNHVYPEWGVRAINRIPAMRSPRGCRKRC